jgi:hypothetical protein
MVVSNSGIEQRSNRNMLNSLRRKPALFVTALGSVALVAPVSAHHGSGISYDMEHLWKTAISLLTDAISMT